MIGAAARAIVRFRLLVIAFWVGVAVFAIPRASHVHGVLDVEGRPLFHTESREAAEIVRGEFPQPFTHFFAVTIDGPMPVDSPPYQQLLSALSAVVRAQPYIGQVFSAQTTDDPSLVSPDRKATFLVAAVDNADADTSTDLTPTLRAAVHRAADRLPARADYTINVTGGPALDFDIRTVSKEDADWGEARALPLAALVLVVVAWAMPSSTNPSMIMQAARCNSTWLMPRYFPAG